MDGEQIAWTGHGKWLSLSVAAMMILGAIPFVFSHSFGAAAGWNIFLALLLGGSLAAGHPKAPTVAAVVSAVLTIRLIVGLIAMNLFASVLDVLLAAMVIAAWRDLRKQATAFSPQ